MPKLIETFPLSPELSHKIVRAHQLIREGEQLRDEFWTEVKGRYGVTDDGPLRVTYNWRDNYLQVIDLEAGDEETGISGDLDSFYHVKSYKTYWRVDNYFWEVTPVKIRLLSPEETKEMMEASKTDLGVPEGVGFVQFIPEGLYQLKGEYIIYMLKHLKVKK